MTMSWRRRKTEMETTSAIFLLLVLLHVSQADAYDVLDERKRLTDIAGYGEEKLSKVFVAGKTVCGSKDLSGAVVGLSCRSSSRKMPEKTVVEERSDEFGEFEMEVPSAWHPVDRLQNCRVKVLQASSSSSAVTTDIALVSTAEDGRKSYSAGVIHVC